MYLNTGRYDTASSTSQAAGAVVVYPAYNKWVKTIKNHKNIVNFSTLKSSQNKNLFKN